MTEEILQWLQEHHPLCPNPYHYPHSAQWYIDMISYLQSRRNHE